MDKIEIYKGFEIRAFEREQSRWRAEIRKADGSTLKPSLGTADTACRLLRLLIP